MSGLILSTKTISDLRAVTIQESKKHPGLAIDEEDVLKQFIKRYWAEQ